MYIVRRHYPVTAKGNYLRVFNVHDNNVYAQKLTAGRWIIKLHKREIIALCTIIITI